jgi:hypothetical protein
VVFISLPFRGGGWKLCSLTGTQFASLIILIFNDPVSIITYLYNPRIFKTSQPSPRRKRNDENIYLTNSVALVRERTIPTERPRLSAKLVPTFVDRGVPRGQIDGSLLPYS